MGRTPPLGGWFGGLVWLAGRGEGGETSHRTDNLSFGAMKDRADAILRPEQARYLERLLPPRGELYAELERLAEAESIPISDPEVGKLLAILARAVGARRILEVGTAIGYGALWLAEAAPEAEG